MIYVVFVAMFSAMSPKEPTVYECVKWAWTGVGTDKQVICLQWQIKDCTNRLHQIICKAGG